MEGLETVPKIFGGEVEITVVDPVPVFDVAGAEFPEWIKLAGHDTIVSVAVQLSIKGVLRKAPPIRKKPLGLLGTWAKVVPFIGMLPLDQRNCIYHCFSQILQMMLESMAITRPSLGSGLIFLVVTADQLNNHLLRVVSSQAFAYDTKGPPPIRITHGPLVIDGLVEYVTGGLTQIMYPRRAASVEDSTGLEQPTMHDGQFESEERNDYAPLPCGRQSLPPALTSGIVFRGVHRQGFPPETAWEEDSIRQGQGYETGGFVPVVSGPQSHRRLYDAQKAAQDGGNCDDTREKAQERSSETVDMIAGIKQLLQDLKSVRERLADAERSSQEAREVERGIEGEIKVLKEEQEELREEQEELREEMKKLARKVEEGDRALKRKEEELAGWQDMNQTAEREVEEHRQAQSRLKEEMWSLLEDGE
ncbi:hypothetical protein CEP54_015095 [Fusarium duplospermum]|uniref:Uncharacterized protein n=1 Tax=Fusarium duplospermum TaxID=1325734 RepID=A0A428NRM4_9HYPO|nr:hypothetical protein CEP54_015095 [Fusarium duplospermum]